jgi:uncharacterized membrane protein
LGASARTRIVVALCLCLAGATVSTWLLAQHHGEPRAVSAVNQACGDGQTSGCEDVARSSWSSFAGLPVAGYGMAFYLSLSLLLGLALVAPPDLRETLAGLVVAALALGLLVDLLLLGVQAFAIHAWCKLCILTFEDQSIRGSYKCCIFLQCFQFFQFFSIFLTGGRKAQHCCCYNQ